MKNTKSLPKLKAELEIVFNRYIRKRDIELPCISCNQFKENEAGHYFAVKGYDGLRFDEDNVNSECHYCNCYDESHLIAYGENLKKKIGQERYDALCERAAEYKRNGYKWSRSELIELIEKYKKL